MPPSWVAGISATPFGTSSHGMDMTGSIGIDTAGGNGSDTPPMPAIPEPSTWAMMVLGFAGLGLMAYRRRNSRLPAVRVSVLKGFVYRLGPKGKGMHVPTEPEPSRRF
jgi:hypothetical protein